MESLIIDYKQEWMISSVYLQTNTKLNIELIQYQSRNQMKLLERCTLVLSVLIFYSMRFFFLVCQHLNSSSFLFGITHFRQQSPLSLHAILSQMHIPHMSISMIPNNTINSYTLQMQTSLESFSTALRDLIEHFDWGYEHNKLVFIYEKQTSKGNDWNLCDLVVIVVEGLELLTEVLRAKNHRQPMIILKALTIDAKDRLQSRSVLTELRRRADPSKKILIAIDQKSLEQFLNDVRIPSFSPYAFTFLSIQAQQLGIVSSYYHLLIIGVVCITLGCVFIVVSSNRMEHY